MRKDVKHKKHIKQFSKVFFKMFASFIGIAVLPVFLLGSFYLILLSNHLRDSFIEKENIKADNLEKLTYHWLSLIGADTVSVASNPTINDYVRVTQSGMDTQPTIKMIRLIDSLFLKHDVLKSVYFYDAAQKAVYVTTYGVLDIDNFYDTAWMNDIDSAYFLRYFPLRKSNETSIATSQSSTEHVLSLGVAFYNNKHIIANISSSRLSQIITNSMALLDESYIITQADGTIVLSDDLRNIGKQKKDVYTPSNIFVIERDLPPSLHIYFYANNTLLSNTISYMRIFILVFCFILTIFLSVIVFLVTKRIYSPINTLTKQATYLLKNNVNSSKIKDEFVVLKSALEEIETQQYTLKNTLIQYEHTVKTSTLSDFLQNKISYDFCCKKLEELNIAYQNYFCNIFLLSTDKKFPLSIQLQHTFDEYLNKLCGGLFFEIAPRKFVCFLAAKHQSELFQNNHRFLQTIELVRTQALHIAQSSSVNRFSQLQEMYLYALIALEYAEFFEIENQVVSYKNVLAVQQNNLELSHDMVIDIISAITNTNLSQLSQNLTIFFDSLKSKPISPKKYKHLSLSFIYELQKKMNLKLSHSIEQIAEADTSKQVEKIIETICTNTLNQYREKTQNISVQCQTAKLFIENHYSENISLTEIAQTLNVSYPHLSKTFKEQTGYNLNDYLNYIRIESSKKQIVGTNDSFETIAQLVGYNNIQSFNRFFKKYEGITPGRYRLIHQNCNNN